MAIAENVPAPALDTMPNQASRAELAEALTWLSYQSLSRVRILANHIAYLEYFIENGASPIVAELDTDPGTAEPQNNDEPETEPSDDDLNAEPVEEEITEPNNEPDPEPEPEPEDDMDQLRAQAGELGIRVHHAMKAPTLKKKIKEAMAK